MLRHMFADTEVWPYIQTHQARANGRAAYFVIKGHYLGRSFSAVIRARAETTLASIRYDGRSQRFTFEVFLSRMEHAFNDLPDGEVPDERKIHILMRAIQDPRMAVARATVLADPNLCIDYLQAVNFLLDYNQRYAANTDQGNNRRLASAGRGGRGNQGGRGRGNGGRGGRGGGRGGRGSGRGGRGGGRGRGGRNGVLFDPNHPHRNYTQTEWAQLSNEQREQVRAARQRHNEARGRTAAAVGTGGNNGGNNNGNNGNNNGDAAQIAAQAAAQVIAQLQIAPQPAAAPVAQPAPQLQLPPLPQHAHAAVAAVGTQRTVGAVARQPGPGLGGMMSRRGH